MGPAHSRLAQLDIAATSRAEKDQRQSKCLRFLEDEYDIFPLPGQPSLVWRAMPVPHLANTPYSSILIGQPGGPLDAELATRAAEVALAALRAGYCSSVWVQHGRQVRVFGGLFKKWHSAIVGPPDFAMLCAMQRSHIIENQKVGQIVSVLDPNARPETYVGASERRNLIRDAKVDSRFHAALKEGSDT